MKLLIVVLFFAALCKFETTASRICGPALTQMLRAVCENGYNGMEMSKKSSNKPLPHDLDALSIFNEIDDETPFKSDSLLNDMLFSERLNTLAKTRRLRHLHGVYDECCRKICTIEELSSYCL